MRAGLDGAFTVVRYLTAPENGLAFFAGGLQFEPYVESIDGATGEEMADAAGSNDHIDANIIAATHSGIGAVDRSGNRANFARLPFWQRSLGFFAHGESGGEFLLAHFAARGRACFFSGRRNCENVHAQLIGLQEFPRGIEL